jgi:hypothetical protein
LAPGAWRLGRRAVGRGFDCGRGSVVDPLEQRARPREPLADQAAAGLDRPAALIGQAREKSVTIGVPFAMSG